jgi:hypothetical protein
LEDVLYRGKERAGVEEVENMTGTEVMTEVEVMRGMEDMTTGIKVMKNAVRKERGVSRF